MSVAGQAGGAQIGLLLRLTAAVAVAVAGLLWFTGAASAPLESVGLTQSPCVRTSSGAAVCGHQAEQACKRVGGPSCLDAGYDTRGSVADRVGSQDALAPLP